MLIIKSKPQIWSPRAFFFVSSQVRTKHDPTKWPVPDTVPTSTPAPFNVQHPLGPPVITAPISPATAPLTNIPPPPMPRSFRTFPQPSQIFVDESGAAVNEKANEDAPRSTFTENLNPDVPEFIPIVNGHEDPKKSASSSANVPVDECVEALEEKLSVSEVAQPVINDSSKYTLFLVGDTADFLRVRCDFRAEESRRQFDYQ